MPDAGSTAPRLDGAGDSLTMAAGSARAELRPRAGGGAELEMRDELDHWIRVSLDDAVLVAPGSAWWFFGGVLPEGASSIELPSGSDPHRMQVDNGLWLAAIPSSAGRAPLELAALRSDGSRLGSLTLPRSELPSPASVPDASLAPGNAPVTLRPSRTWRQLKWLLVGVAFVVLGAFQAGTGAALGWVALAFFGPLIAWWTTWIAGFGSLRLDDDGLTWRILRTHRHRWRDVAAFRPDGDGPAASVAFSFCGPHVVTVKGKALPGAYAGLTPEQLAGLLNAWRNHSCARFGGAAPSR